MSAAIILSKNVDWKNLARDWIKLAVINTVRHFRL